MPKKKKNVHEIPSHKELAAEEAKTNKLMIEAMKIKEKKGVLAAKEFLRKKRYPHWQEFT
jgi:hypothetical protein